MPFSSIQYNGDGATNIYTITFGYMAKADVKGYVDGVEDTGLQWITDTTVSFTTPPPAGSVVLLQRSTSIASRYHDFRDGSVLGELDLDTSFNHLLYIAQETVDKAVGTLGLNNLGNWDGQNKKLSSLADPTLAQDAVTKSYGDSNYGGAAATSASASATSAATSAANAATSAANAATSEANAAASAANIQVGVAGGVATLDSNLKVVERLSYEGVPGGVVKAGNGSALDGEGHTVIANHDGTVNWGVKSNITADAAQTRTVQGGAVKLTSNYEGSDGAFYIDVDTNKAAGAAFVPTYSLALSSTGGLTLNGDRVTTVSDMALRTHKSITNTTYKSTNVAVTLSTPTPTQGMSVFGVQTDTPVALATHYRVHGYVMVTSNGANHGAVFLVQDGVVTGHVNFTVTQVGYALPVPFDFWVPVQAGNVASTFDIRVGCSLGGGYYVYQNGYSTSYSGSVSAMNIGQY